MAVSGVRWQVVCIYLAVLTPFRSSAYPNLRYGDDLDVLQALEEVKRGGLPYYDESDSGYQQYLSNLYNSAFPGSFPDGYHGERGEQLLVRQPDWPAATSDPNVGQVGGVAIDKDNHIHVFHRADNDFTTYNEPTEEQDISEGAIKDPTLLELDPRDGSVILAWGRNLSYVPHGLTIDHEGYFWITDVTRNQVIKLKKGEDTPIMTIGEMFVPADDTFDESRFCKPTDVAVSRQGDIFVADGYCNSRVVRLDSEGRYVDQLGTDEFHIPHSLALVEELDLICVADRENKRIACYGAGLRYPRDFGVLRAQVTHEILGKVYAIDYSPTENFLYAVTTSSAPGESKGYVIDMNDGEELIFNERPFTPLDTPTGYQPTEEEMERFDLTSFVAPHDLAVSPDGSFLVVGEIRHRGEKNLWKFNKLEQQKAEKQPEVLDQEGVQENSVDQPEEELKEMEKYYGRP